MAISSGAGAHLAWLSIGGQLFPVDRGSVQQQKARKSSTFSASIPFSYPGAESTLGGLGDNETSVFVSTRGTTAQLLIGEIDDVTFDYVGRAIHVSGRDKSAKLLQNMSSEKWLNKKGSDIVSDLAGRVGLGVTAEASGLLAGKMLNTDYVRLSDNVSFGYIISKLAELDGARFWVDHNGMFNYAIQDSPSGNYTLNYKPPTNGPMMGDFLKLDITRNVQAGKAINVSVKSWHPKDKKVYSYKSSIPGNGTALEYNYHVPNLKQDHVTKHAQSRATEAARHEIRVRATVPGDPTCNVSMGLQLTGTGIFDQQYEMDTVHHNFGMGGHTTHITAKSAKTGRTAS